VSVQDYLWHVAEQAATTFEGFRIEVVGGRIVMTPRSEIRSWTILDVQIAASRKS
jgi:hypothetical protein